MNPIKKLYFLSITLLTFLFSCTNSGQSEITETKRRFSEKFRPQYHFTPPSAWMNDPNGLVYYDGEYHLFYQYYPDSTVWGPMHWGHAVSTDMVHWEHLPIALYPDDHGYIFSGSAVIDWKNTSGLGQNGLPPMIAIFTYHDPEGAANGKNNYETQGLAYSLDKGRTWSTYSQNPVLSNPGKTDFRDPNLFWFEKNQKWIMALAVHDHIEFYSSSDLRSWQKESEFGQDAGDHGGVWECPNLFPITDSDGNEKWILLVSINPGGPLGGSATQYFIGDFDGEKFIADALRSKWVDAGTDDYAGETWNDISPEDGRRLFIGWMSNWIYSQQVPTSTWRGAMTLPRELSLVKSADGYQLRSKPASEIKLLYKDTIRFTKSISIPDSLFVLQFNLVDSANFELTLANTRGDKTMISLDSGIFIFDRAKSGYIDFNPEFATQHDLDFSRLKAQKVQVFVDLSSIEIFFNDGEKVVTGIVFPKEPYHIIILKGDITNSVVYTINGIWDQPGSL